LHIPHVLKHVLIVAPVATVNGVLPVTFFNRFFITQVLLQRLPLQVGYVSFSSIDPVSRSFADDSHCVFIRVNSSLHIQEEFIRTAQPSSRQMLQRVKIRVLVNRQDHALVRILVFIGLTVFE